MVPTRQDAPHVTGQHLEEALASLLFDRASKPLHPLLAALDPDELDEAAASVRRMVLERTHRGSGGLVDWFPRTIAGHDHDELIARFCSSAACALWRESPVRCEVSLEEALYRFFVDAAIGDELVREEEFLGAIVRALAVTPKASFVWPSALRRAPGGCFAITRDLVLHAAIDGRYLRGPITPLLADVLLGKTDNGDVMATLRQLRLI